MKRSRRSLRSAADSRSPRQRAIADFLDAQTAKIDTLVAKKRTLIERLKEKRTALISRTVTRGLPPDAARAAGLDPHPKLKPSGIDWLGDVPEHWEVARSSATSFRSAAPELYGSYSGRRDDGDPSCDLTEAIRSGRRPLDACVGSIYGETAGYVEKCAAARRYLSDRMSGQR